MAPIQGCRQARVAVLLLGSLRHPDVHLVFTYKPLVVPFLRPVFLFQSSWQGAPKSLAPGSLSLGETAAGAGPVACSLPSCPHPVPGSGAPGTHGVLTQALSLPLPPGPLGGALLIRQVRCDPLLPLHLAEAMSHSSVWALTSKLASPDIRSLGVQRGCKDSARTHSSPSAATDPAYEAGPLVSSVPGPVRHLRGSVCLRAQLRAGWKSLGGLKRSGDTLGDLIHDGHCSGEARPQWPWPPACHKHLLSRGNLPKRPLPATALPGPWPKPRPGPCRPGGRGLEAGGKPSEGKGLGFLMSCFSPPTVARPCAENRGSWWVCWGSPSEKSTGPGAEGSRGRGPGELPLRTTEMVPSP